MIWPMTTEMSTFLKVMMTITMKRIMTITPQRKTTATRRVRKMRSLRPTRKKMRWIVNRMKWMITHSMMIIGTLRTKAIGSSTHNTSTSGKHNQL